MVRYQDDDEEKLETFKGLAANVQAKFVREHTPMALRESILQWFNFLEEVLKTPLAIGAS